MTLKQPGLWRFIILEICIAEGLISTSSRPWSNSSLSPTAGAEPAPRQLDDLLRVINDVAPLRRRRPDVPLVCRGLRLCVAPLRRTGLDTSRLSLAGGICRDHHDVGCVGKCAVPYSETSTSRGGIPQEHPPRFRRLSGNHRGFSA